MAGTKAGGLKARDKNLAKDPDFYSRIGQKGGISGVGAEYRLGGSKASGFAANPRLAAIAGARGGRKSRRNKVS